MTNGAVKIRRADQSIDRHLDVSGRARHALEADARVFHPKSTLGTYRNFWEALHPEDGHRVRKVRVFGVELEIGADEATRCAHAAVGASAQSADGGRHLLEVKAGVQKVEAARGAPRLGG